MRPTSDDGTTRAGRRTKRYAGIPPTLWRWQSPGVELNQPGQAVGTSFDAQHHL